MKNLKSVITNGVLILVGVLFLIFMSQAYETTILNTTTSTKTGYNLIDTTGFKYLNSKTQYMIVAGIFTVIFVSILLLVSILCLLTSLDVIKNDKLAKILNIVNVVASALTLVFIVSVLGVVADLIADAPGASIGWAVIMNLILSVVALVLTILPVITSLKKKKA